VKLVFGQVLFPYSAASAGLLDQIEVFLADGDRDPGLKRAVIQGRDVTEKALRARALPG
jgi:hypothetical protein